MPFTLPDLPYDYAALAPTIDEQTMRLHHDKHHQTYVDNLNKAVDGDSSLQGKSLEELLGQASKAPPVVRNNGGGHWNHMFFWETMSPNGGTPGGPLLDAIKEKWGSFETFQEQFNAKGAGQFGSGWVWLVGRSGGGLDVLSTPNQDNPLMDLVEGGYQPILGNDVWEHAYYLTYNNRRADYLKAWWQVVNWDVANQRFGNLG